MEEYDFGPIIPPGCCNDDIIVIDTSPVRLNFVLFAYKNPPLCGCKYRKFTVNLHMDGTWSFTFTNGDSLSQEEIKLYCREIAAAQSLLETKETWRARGRNLGLWDYKQFGSKGDGAVSTTPTYFPAGRGNNSFGPNGCSILKPMTSP